MKSMRPTLYGSRHAVSAGHYLAAAAGFAILEAGGNAIDAGCAAGIALAVLHPDEVNVAGVAPIMIRTAPQRENGGKVVTIAGLGHWPARFPADLFMREHGGKMPLGLLRTVVPAAPDAWIPALCDYGTVALGDRAGAAIRYRREGFAVFEYMATMIAVRGRLPVVAVQRRDLPARRQAAEGATASADRPRRHPAIHGRPGARWRSTPD
jgi:gamma-glutamyltranspeptidase/glutathione hydrolase